jgi:ribosomal 50S subunit-associated protein YjgA (DUF615 family)
MHAASFKTRDNYILPALPQLLPTLKRLETERDKLMAEGDAIEYAKRLLARHPRSENVQHPG